MTKLKNMSIKLKLTVIIMLACAAILIIGIAAFIIWGQIDARHSLVHNLNTYAGVIAYNSKAALTFSDKKDAAETLSALQANDSIVFACIYDKQGAVFAKYQRENGSGGIQPPQPEENSHSFENGRLSVFRQIVLDGEILGTVYLMDDMSLIHSRLKRDAAIAGVILLFVLVIAYFLSSKLQNLISRPILNLTEAAKGVSENKDYSIQVAKHSNDEIGSLIDVFNTMLGQIQKRDSELVDAKENLETKVRERTEELFVTNKQLKKEATVRKQAEEKLSETVKDLEQFNKMAVGRELRMIELKKEINALLAELDREEKYETDFEQAEKEALDAQNE